MRRLDAGGAHLLQDFREAQRIAHGGERPAGDAVPHEGPPAGLPKVVGPGKQQVVQLRPNRRVDDMNLRPHQMIEQEIALDVVVMTGPRQV
jgi:hypothetical protein